MHILTFNLEHNFKVRIIARLEELERRVTEGQSELNVEIGTKFQGK